MLLTRFPDKASSAAPGNSRRESGCGSCRTIAIAEHSRISCNLSFLMRIHCGGMRPQRPKVLSNSVLPSSQRTGRRPLCVRGSLGNGTRACRTAPQFDRSFLERTVLGLTLSSRGFGDCTRRTKSAWRAQTRTMPEPGASGRREPVGNRITGLTDGTENSDPIGNWRSGDGPRISGRWPSAADREAHGGRSHANFPGTTCIRPPDALPPRRVREVQRRPTAAGTTGWAKIERSDPGRRPVNTATLGSGGFGRRGGPGANWPAAPRRTGARPPPPNRAGPAGSFRRTSGGRRAPSPP